MGTKHLELDYNKQLGFGKGLGSTRHAEKEKVDQKVLR